MKKWIQSKFSEAWMALIENPVVVRDLRAQMRGTKSYWFQGVYLLLLGILAVAGYAQATGQGLGSLHSGGHPVINIVDAQGRLESLYYFVFGTLAVLICLIAPALTASSIVGERQRLSFDLLVTTPLRASELLVGKLVSSVAFLGLLIVLSLPAAALCVLLGGATLGDLFRIYVQLVIDGLVLASIGLFFSCAVKTNLLAVVWSYAAVVVYLGVTYGLFAMTTSFGPGAATTPLSALALLNPVVAIVPVLHSSFSMGGLAIPTLLGSAVAAFFLIRVLVTAATYRLGTYGVNSAISLRRQVVGLVGVGAYLIAASCLRAVEATTPDWKLLMQPGCAVWLVEAMFTAFACLTPFLPALFVPVSGDDDSMGALRQAARTDTAAFRPLRAFLPLHSGALPYFGLLLLTVGSGLITAGVTYFGWAILVVMAPYLLASLAYLSGLGFLFWQISRLSGTLVRAVSGARGMAFGLFALVCAIPLMCMALAGPTNGEQNSLHYASVFYPLYGFCDGYYGYTDGAAKVILICLVGTGIASGYGLLFMGAHRLALGFAKRTRAVTAPA